jgi:hypothetical protein
MMNKLSIVAAAILLTGTGAFAEEPAGETSAKQEKKICKTEKMTGSLTRVRRTCLTQSQWDRLAEGTRKNVDDLGRRAGTNAGSSAAPGG